MSALTVEEFEAMDLPEFCEWGLVDGTVVSVTAPDLDHVDLQDQIAAKLKEVFHQSAVVRVEYPYALGTFNRFRADVEVVDPRRHRDNRKRLEGAPELVIEVMSRSNTMPVFLAGLPEEDQGHCRPDERNRCRRSRI